jgi:hypothetical protein
VVGGKVIRTSGTIVARRLGFVPTLSRRGLAKTMEETMLGGPAFGENSGKTLKKRWSEGPASGTTLEKLWKNSEKTLVKFW